MTWFKVDDKLHSHKKAARAGEAMALWVVAGSWCADHMTDGFIPDYIATRLVPSGVEMADRLVKAGFWFEDEHDGDEGWRFKDWSEYQPTRDEVEAKREYERDKKRKQRRDPKGQYVTSPGDNRGDSPGESIRPDPARPDPSEGQERLSTDVDTQDDGFEHFWQAWPKRNGKKLAKDKAHRAWSRLTLPERRDAYRGAKHYAAASNAGAAGAKDAFRWLQGREWTDWQEPAQLSRDEVRARSIGTGGVA